MSVQHRIVIVDRVRLRLPRSARADPAAILGELVRVLGSRGASAQNRLRVVTGTLPGDSGATLARRVGRAAGRGLNGGGGDGG